MYIKVIDNKKILVFDLAFIDTISITSSIKII